MKVTVTIDLTVPALKKHWRQMRGAREALTDARDSVQVSQAAGKPKRLEVSFSILSPALSSKLSLAHISRPKEVNPKGIPSLSPGLRAASYPGCESSKDSSTLKGLKHPTRPTKTCEEPAPCCNPFRVEHGSGTQPRVARASQPWARGYNPVGIEKRLPDLWGRERVPRRPSLEMPTPLDWSKRGRWFSLSPRERAGVRGNGPAPHPKAGSCLT